MNSPVRTPHPLPSTRTIPGGHEQLVLHIPRGGFLLGIFLNSPLAPFLSLEAGIPAHSQPPTQNEIALIRPS
ncbi:hypothetical protein PCANC_06858 [Puccinia coronata f. sp. avenae]|uniref:Uncharacterized protein n=1 Tax=Puccinia coronata f. sp. avenae TaxID=200324 RepID=A0A2N5UYW1_9BASI|nr:hypothetical protein PCASD_07256 [Puccinia coronata f. sp. avenae]PLW53996.1 hypothetical protein PCANC_06858 [Puccinia coronata f. sp. avenae]